MLQVICGFAFVTNAHYYGQYHTLCLGSDFHVTTDKIAAVHGVAFFETGSGGYLNCIESYGFYSYTPLMPSFGARKQY
jgi:hypothetical protein